MAEKTRERRKFTKEFKSEAVKLLADERYSTAEVAEKLGVDVQQLYRWRREVERDGAADVSCVRSFRVGVSLLEKSS